MTQAQAMVIVLAAWGSRCGGEQHVLNSPIARYALEAAVPQILTPHGRMNDRQREQWAKILRTIADALGQE